MTNYGNSWKSGARRGGRCVPHTGVPHFLSQNFSSRGSETLCKFGRQRGSSCRAAVPTDRQTDRQTAGRTDGRCGPTLTFADGPVVTPGREHFRHSLTADGFAALEHVVLAAAELHLAADAAHPHTESQSQGGPERQNHNTGMCFE